MRSSPLTIHRAHPFMPFFDMQKVRRIQKRAVKKFHVLATDSNILKIGRISKKILLWAFVIDVCLLSVLYVKLFIIERVTPTAYAESTAIIMKPSPIGLATEDFLQHLTNSGLSPIVTTDVLRKPFTPKGRTVALEGDNIQVFEYSDSATAVKEASMLMQKYEASQRSSEWKKNMHVFNQGSLVIFYMGSNETIVKALR